MLFEVTHRIVMDKACRPPNNDTKKTQAVLASIQTRKGRRNEQSNLQPNTPPPSRFNKLQRSIQKRVLHPLTQRKVLHLLSVVPKTNKYTTLLLYYYHHSSTTTTTTTVIDFVIDFVRVSQVRRAQNNAGGPSDSGRNRPSHRCSHSR